MKFVVQNVVDSFLSFLYPPLCIHCRSAVSKPSERFCESCFSLLDMIDPSERCIHCFSSDYERERNFCPACHKRQPVLNRVGAVFDYTGPAGSLVRQLKYGKQSYLAKGSGAYLAAQFIHLKWPMPDIIVPVPVTWLRYIDRGFNQSLLLAHSLAGILDRPVEDMLVRYCGDFSQAGLSSHQRTKLNKKTFSLKPDVNIQDKTILLIDDVMTTGTTLNRCGEALFAGFPGAVYGLTLCRAM